MIGAGTQWPRSLKHGLSGLCQKTLADPAPDNYSPPKAHTERFWNLDLKILSFHLKRSVTSFNLSSECSLWEIVDDTNQQKEGLKSPTILSPRDNYCQHFNIFLDYRQCLYVHGYMDDACISSTHIACTSCTYLPFLLKNTSQTLCCLSLP